MVASAMFEPTDIEIEGAADLFASLDESRAPA
jgi:hypothetical protein